MPAPALDAEVLGAGVLPWQTRPHAEPGVPHTSNLVSLLTVSDGVGKHFGAALSGIQGAAIYLLIKWGGQVCNIKYIQNHPKVKSGLMPLHSREPCIQPMEMHSDFVVALALLSNTLAQSQCIAPC